MFALSFFAGFWIYLHVRLHRRCCCFFPEENWKDVNQRPHFDELSSPSSLFNLFLIAISVTVNLNLIVVSIYLSSITNEKNLEIDRENASI